VVLLALARRKLLKNGLINLYKAKKTCKKMQNNDKKIQEIAAAYGKYAQENGFRLNPDAESVRRIIEGLLHNEEKYGWRYCPCRRVSGNPTDDAKNICPCAYHKDEIARDGRCLCGLYLSNTPL